MSPPRLGLGEELEGSWRSGDPSGDDGGRSETTSGDADDSTFMDPRGRSTLPETEAVESIAMLERERERERGKCCCCCLAVVGCGVRCQRQRPLSQKRSVSLGSLFWPISYPLYSIWQINHWTLIMIYNSSRSS